MSWLLDPFAYRFFGNALLAGILVGGMCGALGCYIVLRRMSYIGLGLSYSILGGVALGFYVGLGLYGGAIVAALWASALIAWLSRVKGLNSDAAIGIVSSGFFALGVTVISANRTRDLNLQNLLFGNILGVRGTDLWLLLGVALVFAAAVFMYYKPLLFMTYEPDVAAMHGVNAQFTEALFSGLVAAVVVSSLRVMGVLLIAAVLVIPAALARITTRTFGQMMLVSAGIGIATSIVGLYLSFYVDVASGPAIVLTQVFLLSCALAGTALATKRRLQSAREKHGTESIQKASASADRSGSL